MAARIVTLSPDDPREDRLQEVAALLRRGEIAALPTETFYGLAADAFHAEALRRLNRIKRKPEDSPILLLLAGPGQLTQVAASIPQGLEALAARFWPGPLTMIVPAARDLPAEISGKTGTVAVRVPGMALPRRLAGFLERPITGISANLHGEPPCRTAGDVADVFGDQIELILDGGEAPGGAASTIVDLTGARPRVVRPGAVPVSALKPFLTEL